LPKRNTRHRHPRTVWRRCAFAMSRNLRTSYRRRVRRCIVGVNAEREQGEAWGRRVRSRRRHGGGQLERGRLPPADEEQGSRCTAAKCWRTKARGLARAGPGLISPLGGGFPPPRRRPCASPPRSRALQPDGGRSLTPTCGHCDQSHKVSGLGSSDGDFKRKRPNVAKRRPVAVVPRPRGL
jgi:hypothetical protein